MEKQLWRPLSLRERVRVRADYRNGPLPEPQALSGAPAPRTSPGGRGGPRRRRGATLVLVAVFLIPLTACVALAIDLGVLTFAQTQLADAADAAALAGARTLNGYAATNCNYANVTPNAQTAVTANTLLGAPLTTNDLTVNIGCYAYNSTAQQFQGQFPASLPAGQNWTMVQAIVTANVYQNLGFAKIFLLAAPNLQATSSAASRPRDICMILDYSGSMRFSSLMGLPIDYDNGSSSGVSRSSNNLDTIYPQFGHYSAAGSLLVRGAPLAPSIGSSITALDANVTATTSDGRSPVIQDFYQDATGTAAFSAASSAYCTAPGGDCPAKSNFNKSGTYTQTVAAMLNLSSSTVGNGTYDAKFEATGYDTSGYNLTTSGSLSGYTVGPGYWGKTFFIWPPDPRPTNDWRQLYFNFSTVPARQFRALEQVTGNWQAPVVSGNSGYTIDYNAILNFINNVGPQRVPLATAIGPHRLLHARFPPRSTPRPGRPPT